MPDLIFMPRSVNIYNHYHLADNSQHTINCMSPTMPVARTETLDFTSDFRNLVAIWGDTLHSGVINDPTIAFWSLGDIRRWVQDNANADVYIQQQQQSNGVICSSTDYDTISKLQIQSQKPKNYTIDVVMDSLMKNKIDEWIDDNCSGKIERRYKPVYQGGQTAQYSFKEETDATLFRVRWTGHGAVSLSS